MVRRFSRSTSAVLVAVVLVLACLGGVAAAKGAGVIKNAKPDPVPLDLPDDGDNQHPSGNDRSVEPGKSGTQGNAQSDPDDDGRGPDRSNGGADKPGGPGGVDKDDQDGNNGCGNDDDFEDDNEGWCGHKPDTYTNPLVPNRGPNDPGKP